MEDDAGAPVLSSGGGDMPCMPSGAPGGGGVNVRDSSNVGVWASFFTVLLSIPALVGS